MKIDDQGPVKSGDLALTNPAVARPRDEARPATDGSKRSEPAEAPAAKVELSARGRELHDALKAANEAPDVRADVVADVRARLDGGRYRVDPEQIARGILDRRA